MKKEIGLDKYVHAVVCMVIVAVVALVMKSCEPELGNAACGALGVAVAFCVGIAKEVWDKVVRLTGFDLYDLLFDAVGAAVGFILVMLM